MSKPRFDRRTFIGGAASAAAFTIVPRHVLGGPGNTPPSEKLNIACIGVGGKGFDNVRNMMSENIVALCDVDSDVLAKGAKQFTDRDEKVDTYTDLRRVLERDDIDVIATATPNH